MLFYKKSLHYNPKKKTIKITNFNGIVLVEVIIAIGLFTLLGLGVHKMAITSFQTVRQSMKRTEALTIANKHMEMIRNMNYEEIGTEGGVPSGDILQQQEVSGEYETYSISTFIEYIDDEFDGVYPVDTENNDYKKASITVTWPGQHTQQEINLISNFSPQEIVEQDETGVLQITVIDSNGIPVSDANISITNELVEPTISLNVTTDTNGLYTLNGAPASINGYHIVASKNGFSTDQTYEITQEIPNPLKPDASVFDAQLTEIIFEIDQLSNLTIHTLYLAENSANKINTDSTDKDQQHVGFEVDEDGNIFFVWQDQRQGGTERIFSQNYLIDQENWTSQWENDIDLTASNNMINPVVSTYKDDYFYVAWEKNTGNKQVYANKFKTSDGSEDWNNEIKVAKSGNSADQENPDIEVDLDNNVYVAWQDNRDDSADVFLMRLKTKKDKPRQVWKNDLVVHKITTGKQENPRVESAYDDKIYVTWQDSRSGNYDIYLQRISKNSRLNWTEKLVHDSNSNNKINPDLAIDDNRNVYVVWQEEISGSYEIYMQKLDRNGNKKWPNDVQVNISTEASQIKPKITVDSNANSYIVWQDNRQGNWDIYGMKIDSDGNLLLKQDLEIMTSTANQTNPEIIFSEHSEQGNDDYDDENNGSIYVSWQSDEQGNLDIFATEFSEDSSGGTTIAGNIPFSIIGNKKISLHPKKYKHPLSNNTTNSSGIKSFTDMEWDTYNIELTQGWTYASVSPELPVNLLPAQNYDLYFYFEQQGGGQAQNFDIEDGGIVPSGSFDPSPSILGAAITYDGSYSMPVTAKIIINNSNDGNDYEFEPWGDINQPVNSNLNDNNNPRTYDFNEEFPADSKVTLITKAWYKKKSWYNGRSNNHWQIYRTVNSEINLERVYILKNNDPVPDIDGFENQHNIRYFIQDYVENGKIVLDDNQAIFLVEFTDNLDSYAADFQDLVMVLTINGI